MGVVIDNWLWLGMTGDKTANQAFKSICLLIDMNWYILLCELHDKVMLSNVQSPLY